MGFEKRRKSAPSADYEPQLVWLKRTTAAALLCGIALCRRLWTSERLFPQAPLFSWLPPIPFPVDYVCLALLVALLVTTAVTRKAPRVLWTFVVLAFILSLWDQMRWQPWFYQEMLMLGVAGVYFARRWVDSSQALNVCRLIVACTYFWGGLQKLNDNFIRQSWPDIASFWIHLFPDVLKVIPAWVALIVPLVEITVGLALLGIRFRRIAVWFAIATHAVVLFLLVPNGENTVVWPWNVAMMLWVFLLFWNETHAGVPKLLFIRNPVHVVVLVLVGVLPALSFVGLWDAYLSSALYSGNTEQAVILVSPAAIARLPAPILPHVWRETKPFFLDINRWSYGELNVPVYPERRVFRRVAEKVCVYAAEDAADLRLVIKERPNLLTAHRSAEYFDCEHLAEVQ